jgi:hypothetical protein
MLTSHANPLNPHVLNIHYNIALPSVEYQYVFILVSFHIFLP